MIRQACILVGGKGTRLGNLTRETPKPLLEIGQGRVFLDIVIEQVVRQGFNDVVLLAGHLGHLVQERYDGRRFGGGRVRVVVEPEPRGTGGALISAQEIIAPRFLLLNGDSFFDINLRALAAEASAQEALIALRRVSDPSRYGTVELKGKEVRPISREECRCPRPGADQCGNLRAKTLDHPLHWCTALLD